MAEKKRLMRGNDAVGEGAIRAGCRFYAGYPITPQNELIAYMAARMMEVNGTFIQAESELAAVSMVFGASLAGARAMTSSSSPGISLKQEGISYLAGCRLPSVIVNVMRGGPGLGNIAGAQSDYFQATKGGGHGDYHLIVLAPSSVQEMANFTYQAFDLADKYRTPVMLLTDGILGQMSEPLVLPEMRSLDFPEKDWALTGCKNRKPRSIQSLYLGQGVLEEHNRNLQRIYQEIAKNDIRYQDYLIDDAEYVVVAFGSVARIGRAAVDILRKQGIKAGLIRPITLYPFPFDHISQVAGKVKGFLTVEMNLGQMVEDVRQAVFGKAPVEFYGRTGGGIPEVEVIVEKMKLPAASCGVSSW
ncbi:MAG: 3-methyl-2-oxobutanoate dehydrogenase subunit VorB [bacterium]|nr:3-methyl-2-oxobutanoate dehydrogenase subunit VorB [bacterium]